MLLPVMWATFGGLTIPMPMKKISQETRRPRHSFFESSDWYIGTVLLSTPVPRPVMIRPTIKCASPWADVWRDAPTMMKAYQRLGRTFAVREGGDRKAYGSFSETAP